MQKKFEEDVKSVKEKKFECSMKREEITEQMNKCQSKIFSLYKIKQKENNTTLKEEYLPLLKYSDISKDDLEDHISNIKK